MMEKDRTLEKIFQEFRPELQSSEAFMERLERELKVVERVKILKDIQIRKYRLVVLAAFVLGVIGGGMLFAFMLLSPESVPTFSFGSESFLLLFIEQNGRLLSLVFMALLVSYGIIGVLHILSETGWMLRCGEFGCCQEIENDRGKEG